MPIILEFSELLSRCRVPGSNSDLQKAKSIGDESMTARGQPSPATGSHDLNFVVPSSTEVLIHGSPRDVSERG